MAMNMSLFHSIHGSYSGISRLTVEHHSAQWKHVLRLVKRQTNKWTCPVLHEGVKRYLLLLSHFSEYNLPGGERISPLFTGSNRPNNLLPNAIRIFGRKAGIGGFWIYNIIHIPILDIAYHKYYIMHTVVRIYEYLYVYEWSYAINCLDDLLYSAAGFKCKLPPLHLLLVFSSLHFFRFAVRVCNLLISENYSNYGWWRQFGSLGWWRACEQGHCIDIVCVCVYM